MKQSLAGMAAATVLLTAATAYAEGLPRGSLKDFPVPAPAPRCAVFHGFYVGGHVGAGFYDWKWSDRDAWAKDIDDDLPSSVSGTDSGFIGGIQAGYNWQRGCTVFGFEADWSWADLGNTKFNTDGDIATFRDTLSIRSNIDGIGTLRTRTGVVVDNLLIYATGGLAFADVDRRFTLTNNPGGISQTFTDSDTRWGWTAGVGTEWAITPRVSIKSEALYIRFEDWGTTHTSVITPGSPESKRFDHEDALWVGRVGLNFKLGGGLGILP